MLIHRLPKTYTAGTACTFPAAHTSRTRSLRRPAPCTHGLTPSCPSPAGNNQLSQLDNIMYLRQFKQLRLVNLAGNPICKDHDYRSYVLSHIKDLIYLDYRRVNQADVAAAREQHQVGEEPASRREAGGCGWP